MTFLKRLSFDTLDFKEYQKDLVQQLKNNCRYIKEATDNVSSSAEAMHAMDGHNSNLETQLIYYSNLFEKVNPPSDLEMTKQIINHTKSILENSINYTTHPYNYTKKDEDLQYPVENGSDGTTDELDLPDNIKQLINSDIDQQTRLVMQHYLAYRMIVDHQGDLSEMLIRKAHKVLMTGIKDDEGLDVNEGHYRTEYVAAKHHVFIDPRSVPQSMAELVIEFNKAAKDTTIDPCLLSGWLMIQFLQIHPFNDGNGRMSRLLFQFALRKRRIPVVVPLVTTNNINTFKDCLRHNQRHDEIEKRYSTVWAYSAGGVADAFKTFLKE